MLGYQLTYGVFEWLGFSADGIIVFLLALVVCAAAVAFFVLHMPAVLVIVATAISGAGAAIAGVIVARARSRDALSDGIYGVYNAHDLGIVWLIAAIAVAFAGAIYQTRTVSDMAEAISRRSVQVGHRQGRPARRRRRKATFRAIAALHADRRPAPCAPAVPLPSWTPNQRRMRRVPVAQPATLPRARCSWCMSIGCADAACEGTGVATCSHEYFELDKGFLTAGS